MGVILDASGEPMEPTGRGFFQRFALGKTWSKVAWGFVCAIFIGGVALLGRIDSLITQVGTIKKVVFGDSPSPADYTSLMSDEEAAKVVSLGDINSDAADKAALDVRMVSPDVPGATQKPTLTGPPLVKEQLNAGPPAGNRPVVPPDARLIAQNSLPAQVPAAKEQLKAAPPAKTQPNDAGLVVKRQAARPVLPPMAEPVEVTSVTYDDKRKLLDITFRNTTDKIVIINQFIVVMNLVYETSKVEVSGTHDLGPLAKAARRARENRRPFSFRVGFNVAYQIEANSMDRHMFLCDLTPRDLYIPEKGSHYVFSVYVKANKDQIVRDRRSVSKYGDKMFFEPAR